MPGSAGPSGAGNAPPAGGMLNGRTQRMVERDPVQHAPAIVVLVGRALERGRVGVARQQFERPARLRSRSGRGVSPRRRCRALRRSPRPMRRCRAPCRSCRAGCAPRTGSRGGRSCGRGAPGAQRRDHRVAQELVAPHRVDRRGDAVPDLLGVAVRAGLPGESLASKPCADAGRRGLIPGREPRRPPRRCADRPRAAPAPGARLALRALAKAVGWRA